MRIFAGRMLFLAVLVVLLPGCVRVSALPLGEKLKACELKEGTVRIFHGEPKERYTALAIVTAQTAWWAPASWEDLLQACVWRPRASVPMPSSDSRSESWTTASRSDRSGEAAIPES